jgi:hypothetical protein
MELYKQLIELIDEAAKDDRIIAMDYARETTPMAIDHNGNISLKADGIFTIRIKEKEDSCQNDH